MRSARTVFAIVAVLALGACSRPDEKPQKAAAFPGAPVIVISIDTLRADHLSAYGYSGGHTPNIDALRADGILFRNAYSHVPLTLPSHTTLLTGLLPAHNGVRDNIGYRVTSAVDATLPGVLKKNGYATGAAVSAYVLRGDTGLRGLFDWYDDRIAFAAGADLGAIQRPGEATIAAAREWLAPRRDARFFLFVHLFEPHAPYDAPEPFRSTASTPYDAEVSHADSIVGGFLDSLRKDGIYDRAIIILLSDHGEGLRDHGEAEHGVFLYREALHVPLIVKLPKNATAGTTIEAPAGLADVFPTIASLTAIDMPPSLDGIALLGPSAKAEAPRAVFSETLYPRLHLGWSDLRSLTDDQHHYIEAPRAELYSVTKDPAEKNNVIADERRAAAALRSQLERFERNITAPSAASAEDVAKLTALGYVSAPATAGAGALPDPKDNIQQLDEYASANDALANARAEEARRGFAAILAQNPNFTDAALGLARALESSGRFDEAVSTYRNILTRNPALTEQVAIGIATALLNGGHLDDARKHAELALSTNPGGAHLLLARIALAARDARTAERHARESAREPHYRVQGTLLASEALLAQAPPRADEALQLLDALKRERNARGEPPARGLELARAGALMRMSRADEASAALQAEIAAFPGNPDAYARLAAIALLQKNPAAAMATLENMVRAIPSPESYRLAATTMDHFGYPQDAGAWRRRAMQETGALR